MILLELWSVESFTAADSRFCSLRWHSASVHCIASTASAHCFGSLHRLISLPRLTQRPLLRLAASAHCFAFGSLLRLTASPPKLRSPRRSRAWCSAMCSALFARCAMSRGASRVQISCERGLDLRPGVGTWVSSHQISSGLLVQRVRIR